MPGQPLSDREREGRRLLSRHYHGDGRWGWPDDDPHIATGGMYGAWVVLKHRPTKIPTWARSLGRNANKVHAVRYHLVATHPTIATQRLTAWMCGSQSYSEIEQIEQPDKVCTLCTVRLDGQTETFLTN